jgi:5-methylcytosine-specific restriction endonuclease McrA
MLTETEKADHFGTESLKSFNRALLLNVGYEPMKIVSWQKAIILWFQGKVEIIEYHDLFIRSVRMSFQLPSVMRLKSYVRPRLQTHVRFCRENVYIRDNFTCQYCGKKHPDRLLTLDHVVPASLNGPKSWTNVVTACRKCNQLKANRTPQSARMPLMKEPRMPNWLPSAEFELITGKVPSNWLQYFPVKAG